ncbi:MAG: tetratricopeptide repeat protein [Phycisphaerales bacterium]|nr:tetratricopeptide repeat protein [Phycisphaerales bacterium]
MYDTEVDRPAELHRGRFLAVLIEAGAVMLAVATVAWSGARLWVLLEQPFVVEDVLRLAGVVIAGLAAALGLAGLGEMVRATAQPAGAASIERRYSGDGGGLSDAARLHDAMRELGDLLREVRDISLLNEPQRQARLDYQCAQWIGRLEEQVPGLLRQHDWVKARALVQEARLRFPHVQNWLALEEQVEQARAAVEARDVESAHRQVDEFIKLGAWDRVADVVQELIARHPTSIRAIELQRRIAREQDKIDTDQRTRLMAQAQDAANSKEWPTALGLAQQLIARYPRSTEADALRAQMATLRENAEIYHRQQMEISIREHIRRHDYQSALRMAQDLIERYPNSPQANALRGQVGKLLERVTA